MCICGCRGVVVDVRVSVDVDVWVCGGVFVDM